MASDQRPRAATRARPDPRPIRLAIAASAVAAISVMAGGLSHGSTGTATQTTAFTAPAAPIAEVAAPTPRFVFLRPGETAPPGATVIDGGAQPPTRSVAPRTPSPTRRPVVRTRQSG